MLAAVTLLFAAGTAAGALDDGISTAEAAIRAAVAAVLVLIAITAGALSLVPAWMRRLISGD